MHLDHQKRKIPVLVNKKNIENMRILVKFHRQFFLKCFFLDKALFSEKSDDLQSCSSEFLVYFKKIFIMIGHKINEIELKYEKKTKNRYFAFLEIKLKSNQNDFYFIKKCIKFAFS